MRIWSIHQKYLDVKRLTGVWRETLLAKAVLEGKTTGYKNHPQLIRFKQQSDSILFINTYLEHIHKESKHRNYKFNKDLILNKSTKNKIPVTDKQLIYELNHLKKKLNNPKHLNSITIPEPHSLFNIIKGEIEIWEKIK
ncbi:hypothetical protein J4218_05110 [Candidatus Pacearchaeota archaeon]|nr:hypothetical protein [uncultured archaeon]MBS3079478.1 hypothetical protein [Candidatus Pacearchaeota archaeon]